MLEHARVATSDETLAIVEEFNNRFNAHDVDAVMSLMTDDVLFENTSPAPDGERYQGQADVRRFWERFFTSSPNAVFETEDIFATADRCVVRWIYRWSNTDHIRGVDVFTVRAGKVAEKLSYVKG